MSAMMNLRTLTRLLRGPTWGQQQHHLNLSKAVTHKLVTIPRRQRSVCFVRIHSTLTLNTHIANVQKYQTTAASARYFHTTPRRNVPPVIWLLLKPFSKLSAMVGGRFVRRWWHKLPDAEKKNIVAQFGGWPRIFLTVAVTLITSIAINYYTHLQTNPWSGRQRYISLTHDQILKASEWEEELMIADEKLLPETAPVVQNVKRIVDVLLKVVHIVKEEKKIDMPDLDWKVNVIDNDCCVNAFVLPNGHIYVYTGIIKTMDSEDQLAQIIGHEMGHAIMEHTVEQLSRAQMLDFIIIASLAAIWVFVPGNGIAVITQYFTEKLMKVMFHLPYSRELESEADVFGLTLATFVCYDFREAPAYWAKMKAYQDAAGDYSNEWLSTHPNYENRINQLLALGPRCEEVRKGCECPQLPKADPMKRAIIVEQTSESVPEPLPAA